MFYNFNRIVFNLQNCWELKERWKSKVIIWV